MNKKLVAYRNMLDLSQEKVAEQIGISLTSYNHKETGKRKFSQSEMIKITNLFKEKIPNITMDDIFFINELSILPN
jgi:putative transcriptional regulator